MWEKTNLLSIIGRDPGDYGRKLLLFLFTEKELQSSLVPSQSAHLYQKDVLDQVRFAKLNGKVIQRLNNGKHKVVITLVTKETLSRNESE